MRILIALADKDAQEQVRALINKIGHESASVESTVQLKNLLRANYHIDAIITEKQLQDCRGTDVIAQVGPATATYVFGANSRWLNWILKNRCFPNTVFVPDSFNFNWHSDTVCDFIRNQATRTTKETQCA